MSDERRRRDEWGALWDGWPDAQPSEGFADRVLAACAATAQPSAGDRADVKTAGRAPVGALPAIRELTSSRLVREAAPPRSLRGGVLLAAAVAAALLLIPIALRRHATATLPPEPIAVAAGPPAFDLGPTRD
jgi:hypothetical protein